MPLQQKACFAKGVIYEMILMTKRLSEFTNQNKSPALLHKHNCQALYFGFVSVSHYYICNPLQALYTRHTYMQVYAA